MSDTEIRFFVMRLSYSQVKPEELAGLSEDDLEKVVGYLEQRPGLYLHKYISTLVASRMSLAKKASSHRRVFWESDILTELGVNH